MRKISAIYYSETGNTEKVAGNRRIANHMLIKGMPAHASGTGCGRPFIHIGPAVVREQMDDRPGICRLFGQMISQQAHRLFDKNKGEVKMADETMLWEKAAAFHGHACGGLTIGYKAALYAIQLLDIHFSQDEELVCISENDACGVDAIQAILGCSIGKGNLLFHMTGKQAFSFYNRKTGKSVRLVLRPRPSMSREESFAYLQGKTPEELFDVKETRISLPERAHLFRSVSCAICGEETAEHFCRLMDGKTVCLDCADQYDRFRV